MKKLTEKAVLVSLSISFFNVKRKDAKATNDVLTENNADHDAGMFTKFLIDRKFLKDVVNTAQRARLDLYKLTIPFDNEGLFLLPMRLYNEFEETMRDHAKKFVHGAEKFNDGFSEYVEDAKRKLGNLFNPLDYPSGKEVLNKFAFEIKYYPVPEADHYMIDLEPDALEKMKEDTEKRIIEAEKNAMREVWKTVGKAIQEIANRLSDPDAIFKEALFDNLSEILRLAECKNISESKELLKTIKAAREKLTKLDAETLRENKEERKKAVEEANKIFETMKGYF